MSFNDWLTDFGSILALPEHKEKSAPARGVSSPMTHGNMKIDKSVLIFNLPPVKTCPVHGACEKTCYALKAYRLYPNVRTKYDANWELAKENPARLAGMISGQILRERKKVTAVRLHSSGDFFSQSYVDMWTTIVGSFPDLPFYAYTKAENHFDFSRLTAHKNFNLILSTIDGKLNYGSKEYLAKIKEEHPKAYVCPAVENKNIHCGKECKYCIKGKMPLFIQH